MSAAPAESVRADPAGFLVHHGQQIVSLGIDVQVEVGDQLRTVQIVINVLVPYRLFSQIGNFFLMRSPVVFQFVQ